jgi:selenocysteine lyase/cysteine desulfurase
MLEQTDGVDGLTVYGPRDLARRAGVFSFRVEGQSPAALAETLERDFAVLSRPGIHCAPLAHETIGTHPEGTTRLSFGPFTTEEHVDIAANALVRVAQQAHVRR